MWNLRDALKHRPADRDLFALVAIHGILANPKTEPEDIKHNVIVAIRTADMLYDALEPEWRKGGKPEYPAWFWARGGPGYQVILSHTPSLPSEWTHWMPYTGGREPKPPAEVCAITAADPSCPQCRGHGEIATTLGMMPCPKCRPNAPFP